MWLCSDLWRRWLLLNPGLRGKQHPLLKHLREAKLEAPPTEKPQVGKTHLRDLIILPEVGAAQRARTMARPSTGWKSSEMMSFYLGEFSITYKPVEHCGPGIGATHSFCSKKYTYLVKKKEGRGAPFSPASVAQWLGVDL